MTPEEQKNEIERLKYEIDLLKSKQEPEVPEVEEIDEETATEVEVEDPNRDDPRGDLAASNARLNAEVSRLRELDELRAEKLDRLESIIRKQGYKI